jgi:hypothetical protein
MKRWQTSKEQKFHHSVYVILLNEAVAKHSSILRLNRKRGDAKKTLQEIVSEFKAA